MGNSVKFVSLDVTVNVNNHLCLASQEKLAVKPPPGAFFKPFVVGILSRFSQPMFGNKFTAIEKLLLCHLIAKIDLL